MAKHRVRLLILAAASLAGLLPADATVRAECNDNIPVLDTPPIEGDRRPQYRGATGEDGTEPPPPPPEGEGGTPTPPGTGRPAPPPPPSAGPTPTPPGGGPGTPTRGGGKNASMSEGGLEHWEDWWHVHGDRYLDIRRNVRESERRAATAAGDATAVKAGSDDGDAPWDLRARALLLASFHDPKWTVRASAAVALGRSGTIAALPEFVRMGRTPVRDVRGSAAVGAGLLGDSLVVEDLGRIVFDPAEIEHLRGVVLVSLGLIGGPDATRVLLDFLDPAADGRRSGGIGRTQMLEETAVAALGMSGDPASLPFLRKTLGSGARSDRTRAFAATSLARLGDREAIPLLRQALRADDATLRQAGAIALGCYGPDAGADLDLVRAAREDRDASTRRFALLSLGRAGGPAGRAALLDLLAKGRPADLPFTVLALGIGGVREAGPALGGRVPRAPRPGGPGGAGRGPGGGPGGPPPPPPHGPPPRPPLPGAPPGARRGGGGGAAPRVPLPRDPRPGGPGGAGRLPRAAPVDRLRAGPPRDGPFHGPPPPEGGLPRLPRAHGGSLGAGTGPRLPGR